MGINASDSLDSVTGVLKHFDSLAFLADGKCLVEELAAIIDSLLSLHGHDVVHF